MEKKYKSTKSIKAAGFLKRNIYYFITGGALVITALVITLVLTLGGTAPVVGPGPDPDPIPDPVTFIMPVEGGVLDKGYTEHTLAFNSTLHQWEVHMALDFKAEPGAQVFAAYEGTVESVSDSMTDGMTIVIAHKDNVKSVYKSLAETVLVEEGQTVATGQQIGTLAQTQIVEKKQGAHLHFEAMLDDVIVDPMNYMPDLAGDK